MNQGSIAPHEGNEIALVMDGTKPMAVIEQIKNPALYRVRFHPTLVYFHTESAEGKEVWIAKRENEYLFQVYRQILALPNGIARHYAMGKLFGYSEADIQAFIDTPPECNCSKCSAKKAA